MHDLCPKCNYKVSIESMWKNEYFCDKHDTELRARQYKYDCPNCYFYKSWFTDNTVSGCKLCVKQEQIDTELWTRYKNGEPYDLKVDMNTCLESYPCQHHCKFVFDKDEVELSVILGGAFIAKLYTDRNQPVPEHFMDYIKN